MPGIAGIIAKHPSPSLTRDVATMAQTMMHEAYYTIDQHDETTGRLAVAWVRHSGANAAPLPVWNGADDCWLAFVGEHFADDLAGGGNRSGPGDANYILRLYEKLGLKAFEHLNGVYCGFLLDRRQQRAILFNDRYGLSRLYIHDADEAVYFASEAKALLKIVPSLRRLDHRSLGEWFIFGCVLQDRTLFTGVRLLPASSLMVFDQGGGFKTECYFDRRGWERQTELSFTEFSERSNDVLGRVIPRYFAGVEPIGMSLTGGVDSRMIIAAAVDRPKLPCYTFGGLYRESADVRVSRDVARICGRSHQVINVGNEFFGQFHALARQAVYRTDGTISAAAAISLFVNRQAREIAPIRMTGNYAGEILRFLLRLKPKVGPAHFFDRSFQSNIDEALATYAEEKRTTHRASFIAFKQLPWYHYGLFALEQSKLTVRTPFLDNEIVGLSYRAPLCAHWDKSPALKFIGERVPALATLPTDRGLTARLNWLPKQTQEFLVEFMPRAEYAYDYGMPQWLAKVDRWTSPLRVERLFLGRQKYSHYRVWYRRELSPIVREVLQDRSTLSPPYLHAATAKKMVAAHLSGTGNYTTQIHQLLTLEMIERLLLRS